MDVEDHKHDQKRIFLSDHKDDNNIDSVISKVDVAYVGSNVSNFARSFKLINVQYVCTNLGVAPPRTMETIKPTCDSKSVLRRFDGGLWLRLAETTVTNPCAKS